MRILDALNAKAKPSSLASLFATTAEQRVMYWAEFIPAEFHGMLLAGVRWQYWFGAVARFDFTHGCCPKTTKA